MNKPVLQVENLSKAYSSLLAVNDISFEVYQGEIFGILGPNGAGKSTTLECILGSKNADSGVITLLGRNPKSERELFQKVGVQFQESYWQSGIRVDELCRYTTSLYKGRHNWKTLLDHFGLETKTKTAVEKLSGGERQKLALILSFIHKPEVIFLDELTTGLDPIARRETWEFIKTVNKSATIILTSHFMDEVEYLCDKAIILEHGKIIAEGTISRIIESGKGRNLEDSYIKLLGGMSA